MRVSIVLPTVQRRPVGGYLVAYEYANRIAELGHEVVVVHPFGARSPNLRFWARSSRALLGDRRPGHLVDWFEFAPGVAIQVLPWFRERWLPRSDVTLFAGWEALEAAGPTLGSSETRNPSRLGRTAALIQDHLWLVSERGLRERMERSLRVPVDVRISISNAVSEALREAGAPPDIEIPNGLDHDAFRVTVPPADRGPVVGFPYRSASYKGAGDAFLAYESTRHLYPSCRWVSFGWERPKKLPRDMEFRVGVDRRELCDLYNQCAVFVLPSWSEGWGLSAAEAMACGAAVVTTANGGTESFAVDGVTALLVPPRQPRAIASAVVRLLRDPAERIRLAEAGCRRAQEMTWESSADALCKALDL